MAKRDNLIQTLLDSPWRVSAVVGIIAWGAVQIVLASTSSASIEGKMIHGLASQHWVIPAFFGILATGAYFRGKGKRLLLAGNRSLERIRCLSWKQFETLTAQFYREEGYSVIEQGGAASDGGVDLVLRRGDEHLIVQCKHWKSFCVGIREVKELFATVQDCGATGGILLTTSRFSKDAITFAGRNPGLELLDGRDLQRMLGAEEAGPPPEKTAATCPACGSEMVRRIARRGRFAGSEFWGCPQYPACKGTRSLRAAA